MQFHVKSLFFVSLFFALFTTDLVAQKMSVTGRVFDSTGIYPIEKASVLAVRFKDSLLLGFARTDVTGNFHLNSFPPDSFTLIIEYKGYDEKSYFIFGNNSNNEINIPSIKLSAKSKDLEEIVIFSNKSAIFYRGDTLVYAADSFKVNENAVVEDLLKKLPGIKVDDNGKISSQGKDISKVLVDGDEFFGSDPTIATKNLGAKGVESVQIYEKDNENAKAGEDEKIQVLDLKLKDSAKKGYFGKVSGASDFGAFEETAFYEGELLFNKFSGKQKLSVFLLTSNTPKSNFKFGDMNKFGLENERNNSGMSMWNQNGQNNTSGVPRTLKTGIYFSDKFGKTGKIGFNYSYYESKLAAYSSSLSQYFLADSSYFTKDSLQNNSINKSHKINLTLSTNLDSLTYLEIKPGITFDNATTENQTATSFLSETNEKSLSTLINNNNDSQGISSNSEAILRRKFKKPKRELELKYLLVASNNQTDGTLYNSSIYYQTPDTTLINQTKINDNSSTNQFGIVTYTEPLSKKIKLQFEYLYENGFMKQNRKTYDGSLGGAEIASLSNTFDNIRQQHRGTAVGIFENRKHTLTGGIGFRNIDIQNRNLVSNITIPQNFNNFLPQFSYQFKPSISKRLSLVYTTNSAQPSINELQPVQDNSNPNRIQEGNPDLKPNYVHMMRFNFNTWSAMSGKYIWSGATASLTNNAFANSTTYDSFGRTVSKTENVNGNMFVTVFAGAGYPLFKRKLEIAPNMNATYNKYTNFINNQENITQNTSISGGLDFEINLDSIEINFGNNFSYTSPVSSLSSVSNTPYTSQTYSFDLTWQLPFHIKFKTEADYTINSRRAQGFNRNIFVINTEISKAFRKTENLILAISGNDLLNQNLNLQRQVNGNVITDNYTKIISRYFLLRLTYKFNNNNTKEDEFKGWH